MLQLRDVGGRVVGATGDQIATVLDGIRNSRPGKAIITSLLIRQLARDVARVAPKKDAERSFPLVNFEQHRWDFPEKARKDLAKVDAWLRADFMGLVGFGVGGVVGFDLLKVFGSVPTLTAGTAIGATAGLAIGLAAREVVSVDRAPNFGGSYRLCVRARI